MDFRIADTFTNSLARLTGEEQKAVKTTAFDLQMNPANPGMSLHKLDKARDKNFWSVRVNGHIRLILHKTEGSLLLCYVDHHDKAYDWAERRKLETHPKTGAAQLVEIRETVQEIRVPAYVTEPAPKPRAAKPPLFAANSDDELLSFGVPPEWLADVRAATEDTYLILADHLPSEAAEALLELATGGRPRVSKPTEVDIGPFEHPDALRRFRVMTNIQELERALEYPWEKWTVFLHPEQQELVVKNYLGPARVSGSAGTGKTIVALHRAVYLARANPESRVLLATFSETLSNALQTKLQRLLGNAPRMGDRIDVCTLDALGTRLYKAQIGTLQLASRGVIVQALKDASMIVEGPKYSLQFLLNEWDHIVDAWQLASWEEYRDVARLGRKTRLSEPQRRAVWSILEAGRADLQAKHLVTTAAMFSKLTEAIAKSQSRPYDFAVIDESQDVTVSQLRFLATLVNGRDDSLFFAGDLGQRIFQQPFSWKSLGVDIRGRSKTLRVNYRTSHQIRMQADRLLEPEVTDVDGNADRRNDTVSVFNGPNPIIETFGTTDTEIKEVGDWLAERVKQEVLPHEIGVFVRSSIQLERAQAAVSAARLASKTLDDHVQTALGHVSICTMHLAKGLEFRAVVVMACDDEVLPLQERIESVGDESDLKEVYDTERQLLYVACTRARDNLLVTGVEPVSEFLDDLRGQR